MAETDPVQANFFASPAHATSTLAARADNRLTEAISKETETPIEVVRVIYDEEVTALRARAKIQQYVGVIASRRVKQRLRKHQHH